MRDVSRHRSTAARDTQKGHHHIHHRVTFAPLCVRERQRARERARARARGESERETCLVYQGGEVPRERCLPALSAAMLDGGKSDSCCCGLSSSCCCFGSRHKTSTPYCCSHSRVVYEKTFQGRVPASSGPNPEEERGEETAK